MSCYEAGRDGFWLHRFLVSQEVESLVVDSASIEVNRKKRRAKTDRIDLVALLDLLARVIWQEAPSGYGVSCGCLRSKMKTDATCTANSNW